MIVRSILQRVSLSRTVCVSVVVPVLLLGYPDAAFGELSPNRLLPLAALSSQAMVTKESNAAAVIELTEQVRVPVPERRLLRGAVLSPSGELIVAWFDRVPGVRVYHGAVATDILVHDVDYPVGVGFLDEGRMEIVDAASGDVVLADTAGNVISRRSLPTARESDAAARTASGWFLVFPDSVPPRVRMPDSHGAWIPDSTYTRVLSLAASGHEALVWQSFSPFRVWRIGSGIGSGTDWIPVELERVTPDWFANDVAQSLRLDPGIWSSTSVVAIGPGYVQTLAHPTPFCNLCDLSGEDCHVFSMLDGRAAPIEQFESPVYTAPIELQALNAAYGSTDPIAPRRRAGEIKRSCDGGIISKSYTVAEVDAIQKETAQLRL
ncbi:hypothetical protein [Candidatus Palauibacter sp.]|uniref:hypothetical protein n=1 Tax=Candidatus Palauibacter sp. TaxID=3101350 RepID=UPI003AF204A3